MKDIKFRPLRVDKKTGKIIVASYPQWYRIRCQDRIGVNLIIDGSYKLMNPSDLVYNHKGNDIPIYTKRDSTLNASMGIAY